MRRSGGGGFFRVGRKGKAGRMLIMIVEEDY
jgi:hypothetical protein